MTEQAEVSFIKNQGDIHFTYMDSGLYGKYINDCRLLAWKYVLDNYPINTDTILDIGCSYGSWADNYRLLGFEKLVGIEPNPEMVEKARLVFDEVDCAYVSELTGLYNTIAANAVIIHILEDIQVIEFMNDVRKCLTDDGYFLWSVVLVENYTDGQEVRKPNSCSRFLNKYRHFADLAGLNIICEVGTFIKPKRKDKLEWLAYQDLIKQSKLLRSVDLSGFSEVLFVTTRRC